MRTLFSRTIIRRLRVVLATVCLGGTAQAATIARYEYGAADDWSSSDQEPWTSAADYTAPVGGSISSSTFSKLTPGADTAGTSNTLEAALAAGDYDAFTVTVPAGVRVTPTAFRYDYLGARVYETFHSYVLYDADANGFDAGDLRGGAAITNGADSFDNVIDLSGVATVSATTLEFRVYYSDNSTAGDQYHKVDNVRVEATVMPDALAAYTFAGGSAASFDDDPVTTAADYAIPAGGGISALTFTRYLKTGETAGTTLAAAIAANDYDRIVLAIPAGVQVIPQRFVYDYIYDSGYLTFTTYLLHDGNGNGFDPGDELGNVAITGATGATITNRANSIDLASIGTLSGTNLELRLYYTDASTADNRNHRVANLFLIGKIPVAWGSPSVGTPAADSATVAAQLLKQAATSTVVWAYADAGTGDVADWTGAPGGGSATLGVSNADELVSYSLTDLEPDSSYVIRFYGENADGHGWSAPAAFTTRLTASSRPAITNVVADGGLITVYWRDNAAHETGYLVQWHAGGATTTVASAASPFEYAGASASTEYFYRVGATNANDGSFTGYSDWTNVTTAATLPPLWSTPAVARTYPDGADVTCRLLSGAADVTVTWAPTDQGTINTSDWAAAGGVYMVGHSSAGDVAACRIAGLNPDSTYAYRFYGTNADGEGWSAAGAFATHLGATATPAITNIVMSRGTLTVHWQDNASNETGFLVQWYAAGGPTETVVAAASPFAHTGVSGGVTYMYRVGATNSVDGSFSGYSEWRSNVARTTQLAEYLFGGATGISTDRDARTAASDYVVGRGAISGLSETRYWRGSQTAGATNELTTALAQDDYDTFTLTIPAGIRVRPSCLVYDFFGEIAAAGESFSAYALYDAAGDGYDTGDLLGGTNLTAGAEMYNNRIDLGTLGDFSGTTLVLRIYFSDNSTNYSSIARFDNIRLYATVTEGDFLAAYTFTAGSAASADTEPNSAAGDYQYPVGGTISLAGNDKVTLPNVIGGPLLSASLAAGDYDAFTVTVPDAVAVQPELLAYDYTMQVGYQTFATFVLYDDEGDGYDTGDVLGSVALTAAEEGDNVLSPGNLIDLSSLAPVRGTNLEFRVYYTDNSTAGNRYHRLDNVHVTALLPLAWGEPEPPVAGVDGVTIAAALSGSTATTMVLWARADAGTTSTSDWAVAAGGDSTALGVANAGDTVSHDLIGLAPDAVYAYRFFATNAHTWAWSPVGRFITAFGPASLPVITNVTVELDVITVAWRDNASNETAYLVQWHTNAGPTVTVAVAEGPFLHTRLEPDTTYFYRVGATNALNGSFTGYTAWTNAHIAAELPPDWDVVGVEQTFVDGATVTGRILRAAGDVTVVWASADQGTGALDDWTSAPGGGRHSLGAFDRDAAAAYRIPGLDADSDYAVRFFATNAYGDAWSTNAAFATHLSSAQRPAIASVTPGILSLVVNWDDNSLHETGFLVQWHAVGGATTTVSVTAGPFEHTRLSAGATYVYRVGATNSVDGSFTGYSDWRSGTVPSAPDGEWGTLWNGGFEAHPFDVDWVNGVAVAERGSPISETTSARMPYGTVGNLDHAVAPAAADFDIDFLVRLAGTDSARTLNLALLTAGATAVNLRIFGDNAAATNDLLQVYDTAWRDISTGGFFTSTTQPYRFSVRGRNWGTAAARYDVHWSAAGSSLLAYSALGLSIFQSANPRTTPLTTIRFRRQEAIGNTWFLDDVRFRTLYARSFQEGVAPDAAYTADSVYIRNDNGTSDSKNDDDPDVENIIGYNGAGQLRALFEFDVNAMRGVAGADTALSVTNVQLVLAKQGGATAANLVIGLYEYGHDFVEADATWSDPDGDGSPATGDRTPGGTLGTLLSQTAPINQATFTHAIFSHTPAFAAAVEAALAGEGVLRVIAVPIAGGGLIRTADETEGDGPADGPLLKARRPLLSLEAVPRAKPREGTLLLLW